MGNQGYQQAQGYQSNPRVARGFMPQGAPAQAPQQPEVPDYLALAAGQLFKISQATDRLAETKGDMDPAVIETRFRLAEALTALADIQYGSLDEDEDEGLDDGFQR